MLNVLIVGGVAGGMSCATRLRRLDETATITVVEKGGLVSYANCGIPYALGGEIGGGAETLQLQTAAKMHDWFRIDVRLHQELVRIDRAAKTAVVRLAGGEEQSLAYDKLVLALGAEAWRPPIDGAQADHVFTLQTVSDLESVQAYLAAHACKHVAVVGGGFIGLEAAENVRALGLDVTLLEYGPHVFPLADGDLAARLEAEMRGHGVDVVLDARITRIAPGWVHCEDRTVPADVVILAAGVRPRTAVARAAGLVVGRAGGVSVNAAMQTSDPDIYAVGDMVETTHLVTGEPAVVALAGPANRQGRLAADHMCGRRAAAAAQCRGSVGASVVRVFGLAMAVVGLSPQQLRRAGIAHDYVTVHPPQHAGWFPGATPLTLRVAFAVPGGRLLGAQVVGADGHGVSKRADVLATALRAGMTVEDLEHLELAYAPPYGAAKDAVNMAGFVGANVLRGDVAIVHPADLLAGAAGAAEAYQIVDVRTPAEFAGGHLRGARNVPVAALRDRLAELDPARKTLAYCAVGYRGYVAACVLKQRGFDVANLDGGFKSVREGFGDLVADD